MGDIYYFAKLVMCFIGTPSLGTDAWFDYVEAAAFQETSVWSSVNIDGFLQMMSSEYWTRTWTLQETRLNGHTFISCGSKLTTMTKLHAAINDREMRYVIGESLRGIYRNTIWLWKLYRGNKENPFNTFNSRDVSHASALLTMASCSGIKGCRDPRDLVYSRIALSEQLGTFFALPDYTASVEEVFTDLAVKCILSGEINVITYTHHSNLNVPSWVPDWTAFTNNWANIIDHNVVQLVRHLFDLQWNDCSMPQISHDRAELLVQGRLVGPWKTTFRSMILWTALRRTFARHELPKSEVPRKGDNIYVIRGINVPVFLRPVDGHHIIVCRTMFMEAELSKGTYSEAMMNIHASPEVILRIR